MLVLAIGDLHIPDRAIDVPAKFKKLLAPGKISRVISLGNITDGPTLKWLQGLSPDYQAVKGEFDVSPNLPLNKVVTQGQLKIGFISGHTVVPNSDPDALLIIARQLDVDVLIWGGSHKVEVYQLEGKFFINPGSATGAFYDGWEDGEEPTPSFCLLDVQGSICIVYIYSYYDGEVKVDKISYRKE
ncbi:hypothetical protein TRVA0_014S01178 [Trichomonascus vanleenenianus]|uniref:retromer subunit VPS29 n=1 Tax=Trichomonascus vanleenenianus TaxID=2268995 RepID=UPI003ECA85EC